MRLARLTIAEIANYVAAMRAVTLICLRRCVLLSALAFACVQPPSDEMTLRPVDMKPYGPHINAANGGVAFWGNGTMRTDVPLKQGPVTITIQGRGKSVDGEVPRLTVTLGRRRLGDIRIDSLSVQDFTIQAAVEEAGMTSLHFAYTNYRRKADPRDGSMLYIEAVRVTTGTLSPSPTQANPEGTHAADES